MVAVSAAGMVGTAGEAGGVAGMGVGVRVTVGVTLRVIDCVGVTVTSKVGAGVTGKTVEPVVIEPEPVKVVVLVRLVIKGAAETHCGWLA